MEEMTMVKVTTKVRNELMKTRYELGKKNVSDTIKYLIDERRRCTRGKRRNRTGLGKVV